MFDTSTVLPALLISAITTVELTRVLAYPKFGLSADRRELLGDYLPCCEVIPVRERCAMQYRELKDQQFLDLAHSGKADVLVSGDQDLLVLQGRTGFAIESPQAFASRVFKEHRIPTSASAWTIAEGCNRSTCETRVA